MRRDDPSPVREKKGRAEGSCSLGSAKGASQPGRRGQAARRRYAHLLGSTRAGEGAGDGAMATSLHRLRSLSVAAGCAEEEGSSEEREREGSE